MDKAGYPKNLICYRLSKDLPPAVSERTVRDALDPYPQYKNSEQSEIAKMQQNHDGGNQYRLQEQLRKKPVEQITLADIKIANFDKYKWKQIAKHKSEKVEWLELQAKQNKDKDQDQDQDQDPKTSTAETKTETFNTDFTMTLDEYMIEAVKGTKISDGSKSLKYVYQLKLNVEVDPVNKTVKCIPPKIITSKLPLDVLTGKMTRDEWRNMK